MAVLDLTIVNIAIAQLSKEFNASIDQVQWTITGYSLAVAVVIPSCGYLADRIGIKRVFLASLTMFTVASAACGFAQSLNMLILFRLLQGIGGGALQPLAFAMVFRVVAHEERGRINGIMMAPIVVAPSMGPTVGGYLVEYISWRWIFFVNLPIGIVAFVLALLWLREQKLPTSAGFDFAGLALSAAGFGLLVYALSEAPSRGWNDPLVIACFAASLACLAVFVIVELRHRHPILDLRLFTQRGFAVSSVVLWFDSVAIIGGLFLLPLFLQQIQGRGAMEAGLIAAPGGLAAALIMPIVGRIYDAHGPRWVTAAGAALLGSMTASLALAGIEASGWFIAALMLARGFGAAMALTPSTAAVNEVKGNAMARASALLGASRQIASAIAVAGMATFLAERGSALRESAVRGLAPGSEAFNAAARHAGMLTFHEGFIVAAATLIPALVAALMLRSGRPRVAGTEGTPAAEPALIDPS